MPKIKTSPNPPFTLTEVKRTVLSSHIIDNTKMNLVMIEYKPNDLYSNNSNYNELCNRRSELTDKLIHSMSLTQEEMLQNSKIIDELFTIESLINNLINNRPSQLSIEFDFIQELPNF